jgi:hypothetical protein
MARSTGYFHMTTTNFRFTAVATSGEKTMEPTIITTLW